MGPLLVWWKFGALKKALQAGRGTLYDAQSLGHKTKLALGSALLLHDTRYSTQPAGHGPAAWILIADEPEAVSAVLTCPRCGFAHVIRAQFSDGMERLAGRRFGRFDDPYQGIWQASWFKLYAPIVRQTSGAADELTCQSCKAAGVPRVRLY